MRDVPAAIGRALTGMLGIAHHPLINCGEHVVANRGILRIVMLERIVFNPFDNDRRRLQDTFGYDPFKKLLVNVEVFISIAEHYNSPVR